MENGKNLGKTMGKSVDPGITAIQKSLQLLCVCPSQVQLWKYEKWVKVPAHCPALTKTPKQRQIFDQIKLNLNE